MLFKRVLEGKSALTKNIKGPSEKCKDKCDDCEHSNVFEEVMKIIMTALALWALWVGLSYSSAVLPYPLNFIVSADIMYPPPMYDYPFPSQKMLAKLPPIRVKNLNHSLEFGSNSVEMLRRLESSLQAGGVHVQQASPEHGQLINHYPTEEAMLLHKWALAITVASTNLAYNACGKYGVADEECAGYVSSVSLRGSELAQRCLRLTAQSCSTVRLASKYRSFDGGCNNVRRHSRGKALTGFKRLLHPKYADGIDEPRRSQSARPLPPARTISAAMIADMNAPDEVRTLALMQWTQFIEHDMVHIPIRKMLHSGGSISCCDKHGQPLAPRYQHPSCMPMAVSRTDPFYSKDRITCLPYVRSVTTFRSDCTVGTSEQMNQASHFLDGSAIYGSNAQVAASLRQREGGLLQEELGAHGEAFLPQAASPKDKCQVDSDDATCFRAGDSRVNMHPQLAVLHTLWLREHNRVARALHALNPTWSDDVLYHEARRIVVAELQHITYTHWLPAITGKSYDETFDSYDTSYNQDTDPSVTNAFASAGLRFVSSLMDGSVQLLNSDSSLNVTLELADHFNSPHVVREPGRFAQLVRGLAGQRSQKVDLYMTNDLSQKLYSGAQSLGLDVLSFDIQRGRDHGLPPYHQYRALCGLKEATSFDDFADSIPKHVIEDLKQLYVHVHDVDLIVGALAERAVPGAMVGPTFTCLLGEQMSRTRMADRYFYSNIEQPEPFSNQQLKQLRRSSLFRLFCDNTPDLEALQKDVFSVVSDSNPLVPCNSGEVKHMNLAAWRDPSHKLDIITRTKRNVDRWIKQSA